MIRQKSSVEIISIGYKNVCFIADRNIRKEMVGNKNIVSTVIVRNQQKQKLALHRSSPEGPPEEVCSSSLLTKFGGDDLNSEKKTFTDRSLTSHRKLRADPTPGRQLP
jgi:hypothetical protein